MKKRHIYDVADWKPVRQGAFLDALGILGTTADNPDTLKIEVDDLDGRVRYVFHGTVKNADADGVPYSAIEPVLMMLYEAEDGKYVLFERQVEVAVG